MKKDFGPYHRPTLRYHTDLLELWGKANRKWLTDKAKINELIKIIPRKYRIERIVFKKEDKKGIKKAMEQVLKTGRWVGLRSCYLYQPLGKAPWIMGLKSRRAIRLFFRKRKRGERQPWFGTPAHYNEWLADPGLKEVIVMFNPKRLCPKFAEEHFVARIEIFENDLRVEMKLNTDQLREMEDGAERSDLIILNMRLNDTFRFEKGPVIICFGKRYLASSKKKEAEEITHQVAKIIFDEWCSAPLNLYYRLQALREFELEILETQGRKEKGKVKYLLAYGLRGTRSSISWSRQDVSKLLMP